MPTKILCLGFSYRTAPVALRERLAAPLADLIPRLSEQTAVHELALLSTCNRLELYGVVDETATVAVLTALLSRANAISSDQFLPYSYTFSDSDAAHHLLQVAAGLDSIVLGESQILGQVIQAHRTAVAQQTIGGVLDALFLAAIRCGKRSRTETAIGSNPASISSVAIKLAQQVLGDLGQRAILVMGAGEMGKLAIKALRSRGWINIAVANRTPARAEALAAAWNGRSYSLNQLDTAIAHADVVLTAVRSPQPLIDAAAIGQRQRPLVLIDIAVPRNVDTAVRQLPGIQLFDVDDLQRVLDSSQAARAAAQPQVEQIVAQEAQALQLTLRQLAIRPLIVDMRQQAETLRQAELARTLRHLGDVDEQTLAHIQHLSRSLVNKLLHQPTVWLRQQASEDGAHVPADTVRDLFGLM